jgi:hypothetical protein
MDHNSAENNSTSGRESSTTNGVSGAGPGKQPLLDQLKLCVPAGADIIPGIKAGVETTISLVKDAHGTLTAALGNQNSWAHQLKTYTIPLLILGALSQFVKGSFIGHEIPLLGSWKEPVVAGFILHSMTLAVSAAGAVVVPWGVSKLIPLKESLPQLVSLFRVMSTPSMLATAFAVLGGLGWLVSLAAFVLGIYSLWTGAKIINQRNPEVGAVTFIAFTILCAIAFGIVAAVLLAPLSPDVVGSATKL